MSTIACNVSIEVNGGSPLSQQTTLTVESVTPIAVTVPAVATVFNVTPLAIDVEQLKVLHIQATADMTIKTNSSGSPADTLTIVANKPLLWFDGCGMVCPLDTDVTQLYVASADGGTLQITVGQDVTP